MGLVGNFDINIIMIKYSAKSDIGLKRTNNEDVILVCKNRYGDYLFMVADGMGGHNAGEVASAMSKKYMQAAFLNIDNKDIDYKQFLEQTINYINKEIYKQSLLEINYNNMGTTISVLIIKAQKIYIGHVGDSRIYYQSDLLFKCLTKDHTLVQAMLDSNTITPEEALTSRYKNVLLQALGTTKNITLQTICTKIPKKCKLLLCSDGLTGKVNDQEICEILKNNDATSSVEQLIALANQRGGEDNISVIVVERE